MRNGVCTDATKMEKSTTGMIFWWTHYEVLWHLTVTSPRPSTLTPKISASV